VNFRAFRGSKFKDTKGTKVYNKSGRFCKTKKDLFVYFRVFRGSKFKDTKGTKVYNKSSRFCKPEASFDLIYESFVLK
jgi:hypothetical protein